MNQQTPVIGSGASPDTPNRADSSEPGGELLVARREVAALREALAAASARERALGHELQHRVRNMLAVIRSIFRRTRESGASQDEFAEHFEGRLAVVARYQWQLDGAAASGVELEDMLRDELLESRFLEGPTCTIAGLPVRLRQQEAELMGLAIHELATNAIKFGALGQGGTLTVEWSVEDTEPGRSLVFRWTETGVTVAGAAPRPAGFGRQLIEEALPYQLGAETAFELLPGGVRCTIRLALPESGDRGSEAVTEPPLLSSDVEWTP